jgi:hypothetical protein
VHQGQIADETDQLKCCGDDEEDLVVMLCEPTELDEASSG